MSMAIKWFDIKVVRLKHPFHRDVYFSIHLPGPLATIFIPSMGISFLTAPLSVLLSVSFSVLVFHATVSITMKHVRHNVTFYYSITNKLKPKVEVGKDWGDFTIWALSQCLLPFCRFGAISFPRPLPFALSVSWAAAFPLSVFGRWGFRIFLVSGVCCHLERRIQNYIFLFFTQIISHQTLFRPCITPDGGLWQVVGDHHLWYFVAAVHWSYLLEYLQQHD